jgi:hypothetical protein
VFTITGFIRKNKVSRANVIHPRKK